MVNVLFIASEAYPFIKTGGLADVVGSLPKYFDKKEFDVRVMLPNYTAISVEYKNQMKYVNHFYMKLAWRSQYVGILEMEYNDIHFYFIDNEFYFSGFTPYNNIYEDMEKFAFFSRASLSALPLLNFRPDIIHCHDWQTGLVPVYINDTFHAGSFFQGIKTVMTIHNIRFQGIWDVKAVEDMTGLDDYYFTNDKLEAYGEANYLKGGLVYSDLITTVSESYAEEIKMPFYGEGLDGLMRAREHDLVGIVNGIDYGIYNPERDPMIFQTYSAKDFRKEKIKNKRAFQQQLGLTQDDKKFMIGICSRLTDQKGLDLVDYMIEEILTEDTQLVVVGSGEGKYEHLFRHYAWKYPERISANIYYNEETSHRLYAACDAFLMPSLFEPCGLSQLMALRYGAVPIVRETGGLKDTVIPYNEYDNSGTGFSFANYNAHEMLNAIRYAKYIFQHNKRRWNQIVQRGMEADFSWNVSARKYEDVYRKLMKK